MFHSSLEAAAKEVPVNAEWRAFELRPEEARSAMDEAAMAEKKKQIEAYWPQVQRTAKEVYGLDIHQGPWGIDTRLAHVGAKVARSAGKEDEYHRLVFEAYWVHQKDISDPRVLVEIAKTLSIDEERFLSDLKSEEHKAEVLGEEMGAHRIGISGVPALVIDQRYLLSGAQPKERLVDVLQEYAQKGSIGGR